MPKIKITIEIEPEDADPDDPTGVTEEMLDRILEACMGLGDDLEVGPA